MRLAIRFFSIGIVLSVFQYSAHAQYENSVLITSMIDTGFETVLTDDGNYAALDATATDGYDSGIDVPEPAPPVSEYLTTYFPHPEWSSIFGDNFMVDVRNGNDDLTNAVKIYDFEVDTDQNSETVDLTFTIGPSYPGSYGVVLYDSDTGTYQNIRESNTYNYTASLAVHTFNLRLGDGTPPSISITYPTPGITLLTNTGYTVTWSYTDVSPIRSADLYYSLNNGTSWTLIDNITGETTSYLWTTPGTISTEALIKIEAQDWAGNSGETIMSSPFTIASGYMESSFNVGWHLTSIPLIPPSTAIADIYGDDVTGAYFVYDYSQAGGYGLVQNVDHGYGYWLALENSALIDVTGLTAVNPVTIPLSLNWNMVGCAMAAPVSRDDLLFTDGITTHTFVNAVTTGWISAAFYSFNNGTGSYMTATTLTPWEGYWLQALVENLDMITNPPYDHGTSKEYSIVDQGDEDDWQIGILVEQGAIQNRLTRLGVKPDATNGFDSLYDLPVPPIAPSGDYVRITFEHPEWSAPVGDSFCNDYRSPVEPESVELWQGMLEASQPGEVCIEFPDILENLPDEYEAFAIIQGIDYDLLATQLISIDYEEPVEFIITVSNQNSGIMPNQPDAPGEFRLTGIHPNPFNPLTTISYQLATYSFTSLTVYNTFGRQVAVLVNGWRDAGTYELTFNGSWLASGIYVICLKAEGNSITRKIVLMK